MTEKTLNCPHCNKTIKWCKENKFRPFCSERCRLIDLGNWANESHVITETTENFLANNEEGYDV